jgi:hypothetical protein
MSDSTTDRRTKPHRLFDQLANVRGPMDAASKARIRAAVASPTSETWENAHSLVLTPEGVNLWQAVCCVDPTFPTKGPGDIRGRRNPWPQVPDQLTIVRALRAAVRGRATRLAAVRHALRPKGP